MTGLSVWNGSAFVDGTPKVWNGSAFVDPSSAWIWNGSSFVKIWPAAPPLITVVGVSDPAGQNAGSGGVVTPITPTMPTGAASGHRIYVIQCTAVGTAGTTPTSWTDVVKNVSVGGGSAGSSTGPRLLSIYYRDYNGSWSMPAFSVNSGTNRSHWIGALALSKASGSWNAPTASSAGNDTTQNTAYSATTGSFATTGGGMLVAATALANGASGMAMSSGSLTQSGATLDTLTKNMDGSSTLGNDVAGKVHTCLVTTGATAALTLTGTLVGVGSTGGTIVVQQTAT